MQGFCNHRLLRNSGAEYVSRDETTSTRFKMQDLGPFPGVVEKSSGTGTTIKGELYRVDDQTLARLDMLEGVPTLYQRQRIRLQSGKLAYMYLYQRGCSSWSNRQTAEISSGDWRDAA